MGKVLPPKQPAKTGAELIAIERERQMSDEGWDAQHDDGHVHDELARVGAIYALPAEYRFPLQWPPTWDFQWWKPESDNRIRELVKAGALIAAEIDRLQRRCKTVTIFTVRADQIGFLGRTRYARHKCTDCGSERWVQVRAGKFDSERCRRCEGLRRRDALH